MTMSTKEADQAAEFLEATYPKLKNAVLTIHTNKSGEIKENTSSKKDKEELEKLRKAADSIDKDDSPYKTVFKDTIPDYRNIIGFFTSVILKESRLISGFILCIRK